MLCVVAHPDDLEFGAAAAVARWTGQGKQVVYCMVTSGEAGIDALTPDECRTVREAEQVESARVVGVEVVDFLGLPDGVLEHGVTLRRAIAEAVRRHRPDVVLTGNFRDTWGGVNLNQADHIAVGRAVLDAVRDAGNRWVFTEQLAEGGGTLEKWGGVGQVWAFGSPLATHAVVQPARSSSYMPRLDRAKASSSDNQCPCGMPGVYIGAKPMSSIMPRVIMSGV